MKQQPPNPIGDMMLWLSITTQLHGNALDRQLTRHDLTAAQLSVLSHLARRTAGGGPPLRVTDIANAVEVKQPAVTKMLAKFEAAGWIELMSEAKDRRTRAAKIAPTGLMHLGQVQKSLFPGLKERLADWSEDDIARFTADLRRFAGVLDGMRHLDVTAPTGLGNTKQTGH